MGPCGLSSSSSFIIGCHTQLEGTKEDAAKKMCSGAPTVMATLLFYGLLQKTGVSRMSKTHLEYGRDGSPVGAQASTSHCTEGGEVPASTNKWESWDVDGHRTRQCSRWLTAHDCFGFRFGFGPKMKCHFRPVFVFGRKRKIRFRSVSSYKPWSKAENTGTAGVGRTDSQHETMWW